MRTNYRSNDPANERGQGLILAAFMLAMIIGFTALTVDVGIAMVEKRHVQNSTDAAALAAAGVIYWGGTTAEAVDEAYKYAKSNGYSNEDGFVVEVNIPPSSGPYQGLEDHAEVVVKSQASTHFARLFGVDLWNVDARSVATLGASEEPYAIIALNPTDCAATKFDGNVTVNITDAGIMTNSSCPANSFHAQGNVNVQSGQNHVAGGSQIIGSAQVKPLPKQKPPIEDPLVDVPEPVPPAGPVHDCPNFSAPTTTLQPGVYECQIKPGGGKNVVFQGGADYHLKGGVSAEGGSTITLNGPAVYTIGGTGLRTAGGGTIITNEALLYIESGGVVITGNSNSSFTAPTDGPYEGIAIFQSRDLDSPLIFSGTPISGGSGAVYAAGAEIMLSGNVGSTHMQFISDTFWAPGHSNITIDFNDGLLVDVDFVRLVE